MKKKNKNKLFVIAFLFLAIHVQAQVETNSFLISNYRHDISLLMNGTDQQAIVLSDYGEIQTNLTSEMNSIRYIYQGHEYDQNLEVYFFPSRMYSSKSKRFFQPDPVSQYFSSYLFVAADPINTIDKDGNEGKPLILHGLEHGDMHETGMMYKPSYNYTLNDFMQDKIPDLPEWDGNVYVSAHMKGTGEIVVERENLPNKLKSGNLIDRDGYHTSMSKVKNKDFYVKGGPKVFDEAQVDMDASLFGEKLKMFSEARGVPLKNVVMAGCEGGVAAEQAADAFESMEHNGQWMGEEVHFFGAKKGYIISELIVGDNEYTSWTFMPRDANISETPNGELPIGDRTISAYTYTPKGSTEALPAIGNPSEHVADEMLHNSRLTSTAQQYVDHIPVGY